MWVDNLPPGTSWTSLWSGYILCGECSGIRRLSDPCPACGASLPKDLDRTIKLDNGREFPMAVAYMGAETRYEDYIYLQLLESEWGRILQDSASQIQLRHTEEVSRGATLVLLFWTYFEARIDHLLRRALRETVPTRFLEDAMKRYSSIGSRLNEFYKVAFDTTYRSDLVSLGYSDVSDHLSRVQTQRNEFVHGTPQSISDSLATSVVGMLKREHESWIAIYNRRVARPRETDSPVEQKGESPQAVGRPVKRRFAADQLPAPSKGCLALRTRAPDRTEHTPFRTSGPSCRCSSSGE